jgi:hypothetical protein
MDFFLCFFFGKKNLEILRGMQFARANELMNEQLFLKMKKLGFGCQRCGGNSVFFCEGKM